MTRSENARGQAGIRYGTAFALIAALLLIQPLCTATYVKLFYSQSRELIQPILPEGTPIPRSLDWPPAASGLIERLGPLPLAGVLGWNIALCCLLLYALLRILNPSFRMTTGVDWDQTVLTETYMHTRPVIKAFLIVISAFLPIFLIWYLAGALFGERSWVMFLRLSLVGAAAWVLLSRDGVAGDYESGNYDLPQDRSVLRSQVLRGLTAGLLAGATLVYGPMDPTETFFDFYRTLGGVGGRAWWSILGASLAYVCVMAFAWGGMLVALGTPGWSTAKRWRRAGIFAALFVVVIYTWNIWQPARLASRYDYRPRSRVSAPEMLARESGSNAVGVSAQQALLMAGPNTVVTYFTGESVSGLAATPDNARRIESFLQRRDFTTALALPAYVTMMDAESLQWKSAGVLRVALLNLQHHADPAYLRVFLEKARTCAATPETIKLANALADDRLITYRDREAMVRMGDLFAHLGQRPRAESLYRRASLPPSQVIERAMERTMFAEGRVTGRILWSGKPQPGLKVGLVPAQDALRLPELTTLDGETSPDWLSSVAASSVTNASGAFALDHLVAGNYLLLVEMPQQPRVTARNIRIRGATRGISVSFGQKETELGLIDIISAGRTGDQTRP